MALDTYIISPLQQQTVVEAAFSPGHALSVGVRDDYYLPACRSGGIDSIPFVTETLGGLAEDTIFTHYELWAKFLANVLVLLTHP